MLSAMLAVAAPHPSHDSNKVITEEQPAPTPTRRFPFRSAAVTASGVDAVVSTPTTPPEAHFAIQSPRRTPHPSPQREDSTTKTPSPDRRRSTEPSPSPDRTPAWLSDAEECKSAIDELEWRIVKLEERLDRTDLTTTTTLSTSTTARRPSSKRSHSYSVATLERIMSKRW